MWWRRRRRRWYSPLPLAGIETQQFDGVIFIGYHASANNASGTQSSASSLRQELKLLETELNYCDRVAGVLAHTIHGGLFSEILLNRQSASGTKLGCWLD